MTGYRPPWERPLGDVFAIPVHLDPEVPAGTAVFDLDPEEPRHITGIRVHDRAYELTAEQVEQVRDHYRAMNERAADLLAWWDRTMRSLDRLSHPVLGPHITAMHCNDPANIIRVTDI